MSINKNTHLYHPTFDVDVKCRNASCVQASIDAEGWIEVDSLMGQPYGCPKGAEMLNAVERFGSKIGCWKSSLSDASSVRLFRDDPLSPFIRTTIKSLLVDGHSISYYRTLGYNYFDGAKAEMASASNFLLNSTIGHLRKQELNFEVDKILESAGDQILFVDYFREKYKAALNGEVIAKTDLSLVVREVLFFEPYGKRGRNTIYPGVNGLAEFRKMYKILPIR